MIAPAHLERRGRIERLPSLVDLAITGIDMAREDQRLRPGAAFDQPALDKQLIGARLRHQSSTMRLVCLVSGRRMKPSSATPMMAVRYQ